MKNSGSISTPLAAAVMRFPALDALRGTIMVLMALDHASYFVARTHSQEFWGAALPVYENALGFITRAVTHLCAPGFFFLMGIGIALLATSRERAGWSAHKISLFYTARGALLIVFQHVIENPAWLLAFVFAEPQTFTSLGGPVPGGGSPGQHYFGVLYALGGTLIVWSWLHRLPSIWIIAISVGALLIPQALISMIADPETPYAAWLRLLIIPGHTNQWVVFYPIMPWMGVTGLGIVTVRVLIKRHKEMVRWFWSVGSILLLFFFVVRLAGGFGNSIAADGSLIGFFNTVKYPPSLAFMALSMGINLLLLGLFFNIQKTLQAWAQPLLVFGQTALFFYLLHLYVYALIGFAFPKGTSLIGMYPFWLLGLVLMYPACLYYGRFKHTKPIGSIWRFF